LNKKILSALAMSAALLAAIVPAQAAPITWTLNGVTFNDGATASGSFVYDALTHAGSSFNISTTAGTLSAFTFDDANSGFYSGAGVGPNNFMLFTDTGRRYFNFSFVAPLTDAGGTYAISPSISYECANCSPFRLITGGTVSAAASNVVPEPGTLALMLPALGALAFAARRRKQATA